MKAVTLDIYLRWGSPENPMKSAYLVAQGNANFCKMVCILNQVSCSKYQARYVSNFHPYPFLEICIPLCNGPIGLIQKGHLKTIHP